MSGPTESVGALCSMFHNQVGRQPTFTAMARNNMPDEPRAHNAQAVSTKPLIGVAKVPQVVFPAGDFDRATLPGDPVLSACATPGGSSGRFLPTILVAGGFLPSAHEAD